METIKQQKGFTYWLRNSITARMLMIGFIILVLLVPLIFIKELIRERSMRQQDVVQEVGQLWGEEVLFMGPVLKIPYKTYSESTKMVTGTKRIITERTSKINHAFFFPDDLKFSVEVDAIKKERGIYETSVFSSTIDFSGSFTRPDFEQQDVQPEDIVWEKTTVIMKTSNLKGVKNKIAMQVGEADILFLPKYKKSDSNEVYHSNFVAMHELQSPFLAQTNLFKEGKISFSSSMVVNGSSRIRFVPIGKQTQLHMTSNWKDPSFTGNFLPEEDGEKQISEKGFSANWKVLQTNRQFEQSFFGSLPDLREFSFGTELLVPVDEYQKSERSVKYGYLVIALTFLVFFLLQTISKIHIHPFQYLMIGLAMVMFYTLLISISEHQNFLKAYLIAGSSVVALISVYSGSILKSSKFVLLILASLITLYAFIFVIIQLESYALLVGSIGLFLILATVMLTSRKIDWSQS